MLLERLQSLYELVPLSWVINELPFPEGLMVLLISTQQMLHGRELLSERRALNETLDWFANDVARNWWSRSTSSTHYYDTPYMSVLMSMRTLPKLRVMVSISEPAVEGRAAKGG